MNRLTLKSIAVAVLMASAVPPLHAADKPKADGERARRAEILQRKLQEEKAALEAQLETARRETEAEAAAAQRAKGSVNRAQIELGKLRTELSASTAAQTALRADLTAGTAALTDLQAQQATERAQWQRSAAATEQERIRLEDSRQRIEESLARLELTLADARTRYEARERQLTEALSQTKAVLARSEFVRGALEQTLAERTRALLASETNRQGLARTARELLVRFEQKSCLDAASQKEPVFQFRRAAIETDVDRYRDVIDNLMINPEPLPGR
jgi:chromosome segregation ATPase